MHDKTSYNTVSSYEISGVAISGTCNGTYGPSGYIQSPNYPQSYGPNLDCRWLVSFPGPKNLTVTFWEFQISLSHTLQIYDGQNIHGHLINEYSGFSSNSPIVSNGNNIYLRFVVTRFPTEIKGFKIEVSGKCKYVYKMICIKKYPESIVYNICLHVLIVPCKGDGGSYGDGLGQGTCSDGLFCLASGLCRGNSEYV